MSGMGVKFKLATAKRQRFFAKLKQLAPQSEEEILKATRISINEVLSFAQRLVPVRTGGLLASGSARILPREGKKNLIRGVVGFKAPHAHLVEFGTAARFIGNHPTGIMPASPFLFPAFRSNKKKITGRFSRAINKSIKDVAKK